MAKDLRNLLEPAQKAGRTSGSVASLAQRRSLTSPGEPRVFRVRAGYICGLCGRLHEGLETAFDCLGRCTIELRLRTPAGRLVTGDVGHVACTACGRGFANTDDAEECFERCLAKMKPSPQFEKALRGVQIRYVQRLQSHGVRPLERIDPFVEHTRMLQTLTQEQRAMGRSIPPTEAGKSVGSKDTGTPVQDPATKTPASPQSAPTSESRVANEGLPSFANNAMKSPPESSALVESGAPAQSPASTESHENLSTHGSQPAPVSEASSNIPSDSAPTVKSKSSEFTPSKADQEMAALWDSNDDIEKLQMDGEDSNPDPLIDADNLLTSGFTGEPPPVASTESLKTSASTDVQSLLDDTAFTDAESGHENSSPMDLTSTTLQENNTSDPSVSNADADTSKMATDDDFNEFTRGLVSEGEELSNAFAQASEFAQVAEQPETSILAADVLALLQTTPADETAEPKSAQSKKQQSTKLEVDNDLLDDIMTDDQSSAGTVFLRKPEMKSYRRNNAKYTCSACGSDFFTKEQVEACFYTHPEEGTEEARVLLERAKKSSNRSAA